MDECLGLGFGFLAAGSVCLLLSLTKSGRKLTRGHNRLPLPKKIRTGPTGDAIANFLVICAGVGLSIGGLVGVTKAISSWLSGSPCQ